MSWCKHAVLICAVAALAACGFRPMYGGGNKGATTVNLSQVYVERIPDRTGQEVRNRLLDIINPRGHSKNPRYNLHVAVNESTAELSVQKTKVASRANLRLLANFNLIDRKSGAVVYSASSTMTASYDILLNDFATTVSEQNARSRAAREMADDIANRLAGFFYQHPNGMSGIAKP